MKLDWKKFDKNNVRDLLVKTKCLYVFYHENYGDIPYYIGKAKNFGNGQSARYNSGYRHLVNGLLDLGFVVYVADLNEEFPRAEFYEQELIHLWGTVRTQKKKLARLPVVTSKPWVAF